MGKKSWKAGSALGPRRVLTGSSAGSAVAVLMLTVLAQSGVGAIAHPAAVLKAPFRGSVGSPNYGTNIYGCATAKATLPSWSPTTGVATGLDHSPAKPCPKSVGYTGAYSDGYSNGGIGVGIPIRVGSSGNHSIALNFVLTLATTSALTTTGCPAKAVNFHPPLYSSSYAYCSDGSYVDVYVTASVQDLTNGSWYSNYSYAYSYNDSGWENYTDCYNYGTPACYNHTGGYSYAYSYGTGVAGFAHVAFNGSTTFTVWANGTNMNKGDRFAVQFNLYTTYGAFASTANLASPWTASSVGSLNWGSLGNRAKLLSISVV